MKKVILFFGLLLCGPATILLSQTGCPGCEVSLPAELPTDTIFISSTPDATHGEYYEADLSFRLPITTTPVANTGSNVPAGLNIASFEVVQVLGVPPGLSWEANQTFFEVSEGITDGCVRFCGTPLLVDSFSIEVILDVNVFITTQTSVFVPLIVRPAVSANDGFSLVNNEGCGSVTVDFINNVPSNGDEGYNYEWDFGNGFASTLENPTSVTYDQPGEYPVDFTATIDTTGYFLTSVTVLASGCSDIFGGAPDLKVNVFDPDGNYILTTEVVDNTDPPVNWTMFLPIGPGEYAMQIVDDDGGLDGADDDCGTINFTREEDGTFTSGDLTLNFSIFHPVDTVRGTDTVRVFPVPAAPEFDPILTVAFCPGDSVPLSVSNYDDGLEWFLDSIPLGLPADQTTVFATEPGNYFVRHTSPDGCLSELAPAPGFAFLPQPDTLDILNLNNLVQADTFALPAGATFSWTLDGAPLDETRLRFCALASGTYELTVIDPETGCPARSRVTVDYDPGKPCDVVSTQEWLAAANWRVFPNPGNGPLTLQGSPERGTELRLRLVDITGRTLFQRQTFATGPNWQHTFDLPQLPAGLYYLLVSNQDAVISLPVVRGR